jgi:hypothetical protein
MDHRDAPRNRRHAGMGRSLAPSLLLTPLLLAALPGCSMFGSGDEPGGVNTANARAVLERGTVLNSGVLTGPGSVPFSYKEHAECHLTITNLQAMGSDEGIDTPFANVAVSVGCDDGPPETFSIQPDSGVPAERPVRGDLMLLFTATVDSDVIYVEALEYAITYTGNPWSPPVPKPEPTPVQRDPEFLDLCKVKGAGACTTNEYCVGDMNEGAMSEGYRLRCVPRDQPACTYPGKTFRVHQDTIGGKIHVGLQFCYESNSEWVGEAAECLMPCAMRAALGLGDDYACSDWTDPSTACGVTQQSGTPVSSATTTTGTTPQFTLPSFVPTAYAGTGGQDCSVCDGGPAGTQCIALLDGTTTCVEPGRKYTGDQICTNWEDGNLNALACASERCVVSFGEQFPNGAPDQLKVVHRCEPAAPSVSGGWVAPNVVPSGNSSQNLPPTTVAGTGTAIPDSVQQFRVCVTAQLPEHVWAMQVLGRISVDRYKPDSISANVRFANGSACIDGVPRSKVQDRATIIVLEMRGLNPATGERIDFGSCQTNMPESIGGGGATMRCDPQWESEVGDAVKPKATLGVP